MELLSQDTMVELVLPRDDSSGRIASRSVSASAQTGLQ